MGRAWQLEHPERMQQLKVQRIKLSLEWVTKLKAETPCADCRMYYDPVCMDFDHVRGVKRKKITTLVYDGYSRAVILEEIAKCELVCSNCHRIRTWKSDRDTPWYDKIRKYDRTNW